ncbi:hypothetical protein [Corynebacterium frankenforstense]|uniref:hypothetical protein n=1 Tax=Corynebacterium frankenforstense TaxID=1230998 RepID=UPI000952C538|nr:hypothetical protein [Corynebacterium frankenforstense]
MGRLILLALIILAVVLLWKAFGPGSGKRTGAGLDRPAERPEIKGPDDDEEFLWTLEKNRFKERRAREEAERQENERMRRAHERYDAAPAPEPGTESPSDATGDTTPGAGFSHSGNDPEAGTEDTDGPDAGEDHPER